MSAKLLAETIDGWALRAREYGEQNDSESESRIKNWLFGAGLALQLLDDELLLGIAQFALESSMHQHTKNEDKS